MSDVTTMADPKAAGGLLLGIIVPGNEADYPRITDEAIKAVDTIYPEESDIDGSIHQVFRGRVKALTFISKSLLEIIRCSERD